MCGNQFVSVKIWACLHFPWSHHT